jgi:hypothetical protein
MVIMARLDDLKWELLGVQCTIDDHKREEGEVVHGGWKVVVLLIYSM